MLPVYRGQGSKGATAQEVVGRMQNPQEQRRHERYFLQFPLTFKFVNGITCHGLSQDVSLGGFFVNFQPVPSLPEAMQGVGTIWLGQEQYTFNCYVTRKTQSGLAVCVDKNLPVLGYAITTYIINGSVSSFSE